MKSFEISASIICADMLNLSNTLDSFKKSDIEYIHFDVMDGVFVPRYGLFPELSSSIKNKCDIPIDAHMMVKDPEPYINVFANSGVDIFIVHIEGNMHIHRTLKKIKDQGMKPGIALNIATPLNSLDYILDDIDYILLMGINPGIVGHKIIPNIFCKIKELKLKLKEYPDIKIMIDGGVTFDSAKELVKAGADILVCGSSTIFKNNGRTIQEKASGLRDLVEGD